MNTFLKVLVCAFFIGNTYSFDRRNLNIQPHIVGGSEGDKKDFPYQASIRTHNDEHICGGSIIGKYWILTSALCVNRPTSKPLFVVVGTDKLKSHGEKHHVSRVIVHEHLNLTSNANNIALLKLSNHIKYDKSAYRVKLAQYRLWNDVRCQLSGWGWTKTTSTELAHKLRYLDVRSVSNDQCKRSITQFIVRDEDVCALGNKGSGACILDDGGPLVCNDYLHGILSSYVPCALGYPDAYTNVTFHRNWILSKTGTLD